MSLSLKINTLAQRIGQEVKLLWAAVNGKESAFSKNSAFNKNFGTTSGSVCPGNDSRLANERTPINDSVSYAKVAAALKQRSTDNDGAWDFSSFGIIDAAISTNTNVSFLNLQQNKTLRVKLLISADATITLPAYCTILEGSEEASGVNGTYYFYFDCWNDAVGNEEVLVSITKPAS
jgi:hypothetical protein